MLQEKLLKVTTIIDSNWKFMLIEFQYLLMHFLATFRLFMSFNFFFLLSKT